jgi:acetolactate synthase-1/2/3 large subunit
VVERIAYLAELASVQLAGLDHLILVDAKAPVSFFAYPGKKSDLVPPGCNVIELAGPSEDVAGSLDRLVKRLDASGPIDKLLQPPVRPALPEGDLTADKACQAIGALLPENAIISDEAQTSGVKLPVFTAGAPRHDLLTLTGGAIGQGLPVAVGAAVACPGRKVFALAGDGSAMYTNQALWTMARERLDIITIVFNNRAYAILNMELERTGARQAGPVARSQLDLTRPDIDFTALGLSMGVPSVRAETCEQFNQALRDAIDHPGPHLIEAIVPSAFSGLKLKALPYALNALKVLPGPVARVVKRRIAP